MVVVEGRVEEVVMVVSGKAVSLGDAVLGTDESGVTALVEIRKPSLASVTESVVVDKPDIGMLDMVVEGEEDVAMTDVAASPPSAGPASTERITFGSGKVNSVDIFVDAVTELSSPGAEAVSKVVMEGVLIVAELEVTGRLGLMDSEEVEVTEAVAGGSGGVVELVVVVGKVEMGSSVVVASRTEVLLSSSVAFVGVVAAAAGSTESVHISVSEAVTVLEGQKLAESGIEFETVGVVVAGGGGDGTAVGLGLVGVCVSASCIWVSSFSGVLRPDVVGGGPGLRTGFGSKAGFPADSCADTLGRI